MEAGNWGQTDSVVEDILVDEAWQHVKIGRSVGTEAPRELSCDLRQLLVVPERLASVQRGGHEDLELNSRLTQPGTEQCHIVSTSSWETDS